MSLPTNFFIGRGGGRVGSTHDQLFKIIGGRSHGRIVVGGVGGVQ